MIYKTNFYKFSKLSFLFQEYLGIVILLNGCYFFPYIYNLLIKSLKSIILNQTEVEQEKKIKGKTLAFRESLEIVFGTSFLFYLLPMKSNGLSNYLEEADEDPNNVHPPEFHSDSAGYYI